MLRDLAALGRGLWNHWIALMSGVASVLTALWLQIAGKPAISPTGFWIIAAVCLALAFVLAWRDLRREVERQGAPILRVAFSFAGVPERPRVLPLRVLICNDGREPATAAQVELAFDARVVVRGEGAGSMSMKGQGSSFLPTHSYLYSWGGPRSFPVFEGSAPALVVDLYLEVLDFAGDGPFAICWRVATPRALETSGAGVFRWNERGMSLNGVTARIVRNPRFSVVPGRSRVGPPDVLSRGYRPCAASLGPLRLPPAATASACWFSVSPGCG